ncbi:uncharacterized protein PHALS_13663 [Plasmopara halstedii]|uniref:Uncharacterized protein n=1 Tax=Plasmopara halstedii TaxID=4781 RepID=A0A0P1ARB9_PLAHL|nr:uncharacterized protein PHALS_13663 [Plasmopara halstedii]CEG43469.1 hypothetical protein PHALS_13663 [Plasmopara halstedii]|eukprot:XP_024579838.1 hypothetical protein PHALS_13663 [Plasmopara halstedii]
MQATFAPILRVKTALEDDAEIRMIFLLFFTRRGDHYSPFANCLRPFKDTMVDVVLDFGGIFLSFATAVIMTNLVHSLGRL